MANVKKENSKAWSEEAIDTLINCFQSQECLRNVARGDKLIYQCKNITWIDLTIKKIN